MQPPADPLAPFSPYLLEDPRHGALLPRLLGWSMECSADPDQKQLAKRAFLASTFGVACAPRSASVDEVFISTKFLMLFFLIDDAPASVLDELVGALGTAPTTAPPGLQAECLAYHASLVSDLRACSDTTEGFEHALRDIVGAMQREKQQRASEWSFEQLLAIRKVVIGIPAFSECWRAIRGLSFTPAVQTALRQSRVLDITCETACIINDLASLVRDEQMMATNPEHADPNLVLVRMRDSGDRHAAIDGAVEWYNRRVHEFHRAERSLLGGEHGADPSLAGYLEVLRCAITGDLATSKRLAPLRYEGSLELLDRLVRLDQMR